MKTLLEKVEWARASGYTRRYHGWRMLLEDPVGLHERNVVKIGLLLDPDVSRNWIIHALGHDDAEWIVGDMPAPAKRRLPDYHTPYMPEEIKSFREVFGEMEDAVLAEAEMEPLPTLTKEETWLLKFCDSMDGLLFACQEIAMGNTLMIPVWQAFESYLDTLLGEPVGVVVMDAQRLYSQILKKGDYRGRK